MNIPTPPIISGSKKLSTLQVSTLKVNSIIENNIVYKTFNTGVTPAGLAISTNGKFL
jgi:hypothetical protein